jgi:ABC-type nitrate/sulfonate/bicarbonate transport system substrate-binding protein
MTQAFSRAAQYTATCAMAWLLIACTNGAPGQPQGTSAPPPATQAQSQPTSAKPQAAQAQSPATPAAPAPAATSAAPASVTVGQAVPTVGGAPIYVAIENGYYAEQNITFNLTQLQSGSTATQAIASGSVDFVNAGSFDVATAVGKGVPLQAFLTFSGVAIETCLSTELAQAHHLTSTSTAEEVMGALNGRTVGITGPNSAPDLVLRYMLQKHANLKPDADVKIVSLGSIPAELTALQRGQIDGFLQSPPACEQAQAAGTGVPLLRPAQYPPDMQGMPLGVFYSRREYVQGHADVLTRVAAATVKGANFARTNTDETIAILKKYFPSVEDDTLRETLVNIIQPTLTKDGKMSADAWSKVVGLLRSSGAIDRDVNTDQGELWTNAYLP